MGNNNGEEEGANKFARKYPKVEDVHLASADWFAKFLHNGGARDDPDLDDETQWAWADEFRKLLDPKIKGGGRTREEFEVVIYYLRDVNPEFWLQEANIQTPLKFRRKNKDGIRWFDDWLQKGRAARRSPGKTADRSDKVRSEISRLVAGK